MAESDVAMKVWLKDKARFADFFNGTVFNGEQVIDKSQLKEVDSESDIIVSDENNDNELDAIRRHRDVVMRWKDNINLAILAIENQSNVNHEMPVRDMVYDALSYDEQVKAKKKAFGKYDSIYPVITIVFYYGTKPWDSNRDLYDMFKEINSHKLRDELLKYTPNYKMNLVDATSMEDMDKFKTDLHIVFGMLKCRENRDELKKYIYNNGDFFKVIKKDTIDAIVAMMKIEGIKEYIPDIQEGESVDMCKALDDLCDEMVEKGIEKGREENLTIVVKNLLTRGFSIADICAITECEEEIVHQVEGEMA